MGSWSSTKRMFAHDGKVHGTKIKGLEFNWNPSDYKRLLQRLDKLASRTEIRGCVNRAAKKAADEGVKAVKNGLAAKTTLKKSDIGKRVKRYAYGNPESMSIEMKISDTARPLSDFAFKPKKPKWGAIPVVEVYKGHKKAVGADDFKPQKHKTNKNPAFAAEMKTGHVGLFFRENEKRKSKRPGGGERADSREKIHINSLVGPAVTGLFKANEDVHKAAWDKIFETFEERVKRELENLLHA